MSLDYNRLWKLLIDKGLTKTQLREQAGFSTRTLAAMNKNEPINLKYIESICEVLSCRIEDVVEYKQD